MCKCLIVVWVKTPESDTTLFSPVTIHTFLGQCTQWFCFFSTIVQIFDAILSQSYESSSFCCIIGNLPLYDLSNIPSIRIGFNTISTDHMTYIPAIVGKKSFSLLLVSCFSSLLLEVRIEIYCQPLLGSQDVIQSFYPLQWHHLTILMFVTT